MNDGILFKKRALTISNFILLVLFMTFIVNDLFSQNNGNEIFPYDLALKNCENDRYLRGGYTYDGEVFSLVLVKKEIEQSWNARSLYIYVLSLDAMFSGQCLFPAFGSSNNIFIDDNGPREIMLGQNKFIITPPYGKDSYFLIASELPLLNMEKSEISDFLEDSKTGKLKYVYTDVIVLESVATSFNIPGHQLYFDQLSTKGDLIKDIPVLMIAYPEPTNENIIVNKSALRFYGFAQALSGIKEIKINGETAEIKVINPQNCKWERIINLQPGNNLVNLTAVSIFGDSVIDSISVFYDNTRGITMITSDPEDSMIVGKNKALFFATDIFDFWSDLKNPIFDAKVIAKDLTDIYGFNVDTLFNPAKNDIIKKLKEYINSVFDENDQLMIYFSGHGYFDETLKEGFIVTKDSKENDEFFESYLPHSSLMRMINNIPCNHILVVLDVCYAGTFDEYIALNKSIDIYSEKDKDSFIKGKLNYKTRIYLASTRKNVVSDGIPGEHSPFARKFLEALRTRGGADQILTMSEIKSIMDKLPSEPMMGEFKGNEPGSDFLFIAR